MKINLLILSLICLKSLGQIEHLEPAEWWVGMKDPQVQLMIHGKDIKNKVVRINYPGVKILKINQAQSSNYLFIDLLVSPTAKPGKVPIQVGSDQVNFALHQRKPKSAQRTSFGPGDAIYLITPDRFANGNPNNDNVEGYKDSLKRTQEYGRHGGDIAGMSQHLSYIKSLGMTAIWPMPLEENKMDQWSYHGYAITDFYKVDPRFGTESEFKNLMAECQKQDIKFIKDVVLNHCGIGHWWMADMPFADWINNGGTFASTNHKREVTRDPHASQYDRDKFTNGWFVPTMPDLNQANPFMAKYLIQNTLWWLEKYDISGLRVDTYPYSSMQFLKDWSHRMIKEYPNLSITTEEWTMNAAIGAYWQKGKKNSDGNVSYTNTPMDFSFQEALVKALNEKEEWNSGLSKIHLSLTNDFQYADPSQILIFGDNHDMSRLYTQLGHDISKLKMALSIIATTRGIPQIYYGTEVLMSNPKSDSHGEIRADMPGGWGEDPSNVFNNTNLSYIQIDMLDFTKALFTFRKSSDAIANGQLIHFVPENGTYVYFRISPKQKLMIVVNKNQDNKDIDLSRYSEILGSSFTLKNVFEGTIHQKNFIMKPSSVEIFTF